MSQGLNVKHLIRSRVGVGSAWFSVVQRGSAWFSATCEVKQFKNRIRGRVIGQGHTQGQSAGAEAGAESGSGSRVKGKG